MHSSTSIAIRFRKSIVVGFIRFSPSEIVGNSSGRPPASSTPRFTASASPRKCRLQLTSSDHELQMPTTGRPASASREIPSAWIEARWMNPEMSRPPNHRSLRNPLTDCSITYGSNGESFLAQLRERRARLAELEAHPAQHLGRLRELHLVVLDDFDPVAVRVEEVEPAPGEDLGARRLDRAACLLLVVDDEADMPRSRRAPASGPA